MPLFRSTRTDRSARRRPHRGTRCRSSAPTAPSGHLRRMTPPCSTAASPARCASRRPPKRSRRSCASPSSTVLPWSPWRRHRPRRWRDPAGAARRGVDRPDEQGAVGRYQQPHRLGATRRHQSRPLEEAAAQGVPLRPRPVKPTGLHARRQCRQQFRRPPLPRLRRHRCPRRVAGSRAARRADRRRARRRRGRDPRPRPLRQRPSAARARSGSPPRSGVRITPNAPWPCAPCCWSFATVRDVASRPSATSSPPASHPPRSR